MIDPETVRQVTDLLNAVGTVGVLVWLTLAFYRGDIVSRRTLERILERYERQFAESTARILERVDEAMRRGRL